MPRCVTLASGSIPAEALTKAMIPGVRNKNLRDFPGGPVVTTSTAGGTSSIPVRELRSCMLLDVAKVNK